MMTENAIIYLRSARVDKSALAEKQKLCEDCAGKMGWGIEGVIVDHGHSGLVDRPGLVELRRRVRNGSISIVLTPSISHISRDVQLYLRFTSLCDRKNVKIVDAYGNPFISFNAIEKIVLAAWDRFDQEMKVKESSVPRK